MPFITHTQRLTATLLAITAFSALNSCGKSEKKTEAAAVVYYGTMTLSDSKAVKDAGTFSLTSAEKCARNVDTGRVDLTLSQGTGKPSLNISIKDYSATAKIYKCKQASDNRESTTDVGGKFESCMTEVKALSTSTATVLNGYSMYREIATTKPFAYSGQCTIEVKTAVPAISGTIDCTDLVQTTLEGTARNPIDTSVTADIKADFNCTFR